MCEPKRRYGEKEERGVKLGYYAFLKFYETTQGSAKLKTEDDFITSPYYRAFVKWGRYCISVKAISPEHFLEWLLKHNKKIDNWATDKLYDEYLVHRIKTEPMDDALARSIEQSLEWSDKTGNPNQDYLRFGNDNAICYSITTGKVSPWALYNSVSGVEFIERLNADQLTMIWPYIDANHWNKRFADSPGDKAYAEEMLKQLGW